MAWTFVSLHAMKPARSRGRRRWDARNLISTQVSPELSPVAVEANAQKLVTLLAVLGFSIDSVAERRGNKLLVTFIGAANCWGLRSLSQGNPLARPPLVNDFGAKVRRMCENGKIYGTLPRVERVSHRCYAGRPATAFGVIAALLRLQSEELSGPANCSRGISCSAEPGVGAWLARARSTLGRVEPSSVWKSRPPRRGEVPKVPGIKSGRCARAPRPESYTPRCRCVSKRTSS